MSEEEPKVIKKRIPIKDFWKRYWTVGHPEGASGPLPDQKELRPQKPPEVIQEETKEAQIEDWRKRTDI